AKATRSAGLTAIAAGRRKVRSRASDREPARAGRARRLHVTKSAQEPGADSSSEAALQRHADAHGDRLIVAIILADGRADTDESNKLAAQIGARADVEQKIIVVSLEHGYRECPWHRNQSGAHAPVVVVVILLPGDAPKRPQRADAAAHLPAQTRRERVALLLTECHRGAAGSRLGPRVDLGLLIGQAGEGAMDPRCGSIEPVTTKDPPHQVCPTRIATFGAAACAEREAASNIAEIQVAATEACTDVPR